MDWKIEGHWAPINTLYSGNLMPLYLNWHLPKSQVLQRSNFVSPIGAVFCLRKYLHLVSFYVYNIQTAEMIVALKN